MTSFLKSNFKRIFIITLALLAVLFLLQIAISYALHNYRTKLITYLDSTFGYRFALERISFSFLSGVHIGEFSLFDRGQERAPIFIKDAFIRPGILPLLLGKLVIRIQVTEAVLLVSREKEGMKLQIIFSDIYKKASQEPPRLPAALKSSVEMSIKTAKITYIDNPALEKNMHLVLQNCKLYQEPTIGRFSCDIDFIYQLAEGASIFKENRIAQKIKCAIQTRIQDNDLYMDYITLNTGRSQLIGSGVNKNFAEKNPHLEVNFGFSPALLEDFISLKNTFGAQGTAVILLIINGPMDDIKPAIIARLYDCQLQYPLPDNEFFEIEKLNGEIELQGNLIKVKNASLKSGKTAVNIDRLFINASPNPDITLGLSFPEEFLASQNLPLQKLQVILSGKIGDSLSGDLKINALYLRKDLRQDMQVNLDKINLDYKNPGVKYFRAETIQLLKDNSYKIQKLNFTGFNAKIYLGKRRVEIKDLNFSGYNALLNGEMELDYTDKPALVFALKGAGLDAKTLMADMNTTDKLFSGTLDFGISFDNHRTRFLKGNCKIKDGFADLGTVATILELPALRNMYFNNIDAGFSITREKVIVDKINLSNPPHVSLEAFWETGDKIDGRLNLVVNSKLLKESHAFRKLLELSRLKNDYVDFRFLLKGDDRNPRIMWLKGEFKDKLKQNISGWIERKIEEEIDRIINNLSDQ